MNPRRRSQSSLVANPVLVGAATALLVVVSMFLAYNANSGLPFVPTYEVTAIVPDSAELVPGNDVRIGGKRVGAVSDLVPRPGKNGIAEAEVVMKLEQTVEPLKDDTKVTIRPRSPLGLKYVELIPGEAGKDVASGGEIPLAQAQPIVSLDEAFNTFDDETRSGVRGILQNFGEGVAGRGASLNELLGDAPELVDDLRKVSTNLASRETDLDGFLDGAHSAASAVAPVAPSLARALTSASTTFEGLAGARVDIEATLVESPPTLSATERALRVARPVLADARVLVADLAPGIDRLPRSARLLDRALRTGTPTLRDATRFAKRLDGTLDSLERLVSLPATLGSLKQLTTLVGSLRPTLDHLIDFQVKCNYLGLWTRNVPGVISEGDHNGNWFRFAPLLIAEETFQEKEPGADLHVTLNPDTGQNGECEVGNEVYTPGQTITIGAPGKQPLATELTSRRPGVPRP